eukprot:SAG31_NODE_44010_length_264_cov_1.260606_1_plen_58_part_00
MGYILLIMWYHTDVRTLWAQWQMGKQRGHAAAKGPPRLQVLLRMYLYAAADDEARAR